MIRSLIALLLIGLSALPAHSQKPCNFGIYTNGDECTIQGKVICRFDADALPTDMASRWTCRTKSGKRLYWQRRKGKWHLVRRRR
ncbi:MAG: hypothetical protein AAF732_23140 [Pseudomonadota bacterium]